MEPARETAASGRLGSDAERALQESEERFRRVVADAPQPMLLHASDGEVIALNRRWQELSGYADHALPTLEELARGLFAEGGDAILEDLASVHGCEGRIEHGEHEIRTRGGQTRSWELYSSPLPPHRDGRAVAITMADDVTEARRAEEELRRSNAELERFAYAASHDLQEPLRMVTSYAQLLKRRYGGTLDASADRYIEYAVDGAKRMQELISALLTYSRVGRGEIESEPLDTGALVRSAAGELAAALRESGAELVVDALPRVRGTAFQLRLVFQNLIANALKYRSDAPPRIHVGADPAANGLASLYVQDNGIGFEPEYAERVFRPFERLHERARYGGAGLGLALVERVVSRHGGNVSVDSAPGRGSTFRIRLPRAPEAARTRPEGTA